MANPFRALFGSRTPTADLAAPGRPVLGELATLAAGRDITRGVVEGLPLLPPQDEWQGRGGGLWLDVYRAVLDDFQVFSALQQRRLGLIATEWEVLPGGASRKDKQAAELIRNVIEDVLPWDRVTEQMHYGVFYGYAVSELVWQRDGRHIIPEAIKTRDQRRFAYDPEGRLRLLTVGNPLGELLPERKFWTFSTGATHEDDPYGMGLAHWCFWPAQFKRGVAKLWLIALDKYASPTAMGHFPPGASADEQAKLLAALAAIRNQSALILPEGMTAELLAASRSGGADYDTAARYWDTAISKIILGHSAGADSTPGRLGGEDSSDAVRADLVTADADVLCGSANATWVRWVTEWSYPGAVPPQIWRRTDEEEDLSERADRERKLFDIGYRPTLAQVVATYGGEWERVGTATPETLADGETPTSAHDTEPAEPTETDDGDPAEGSGARVGEADPDDEPADLAAPLMPPDYAQQQVARLGRAAEPAVLARVARIRAELDAALAAGEEVADFRERLLGLYPDLPEGGLSAVLGEALAAADLAGRLAVQEGRP